MLDAAEHALQLEGFRRDQVLELRLRRPPLSESAPIATFLDSVAAASPTPGGGTVAAFTGALAACLATMVANLTVGKKKYAAAEPEMRRILSGATELRTRLMALSRRDAEAFDAVLRARRMPASTAEETTARDQALAHAELESARVPLETAEACLAVVGLAASAAASGNVNAVTDAGVAGLLAAAGAEGALLNVQINLKSLADGADKEDVHKRLQRLAAAVPEASEGCRRTVQSILTA